MGWGGRPGIAGTGLFVAVILSMSQLLAVPKSVLPNSWGVSYVVLSIL